MTKDDIIKLEREAGFERLGTYAFIGEDWVAFTESLEAFAKLIAEHEREACAKVCESHVRYPSRLHFATAIRARGNT